MAPSWGPFNAISFDFPTEPGYFFVADSCQGILGYLRSILHVQFQVVR
jgi:hypothetical protein